MTGQEARQNVDRLREEYERLSAEAKKRYQVSHGYWEQPYFAAVREALDYYQARYDRFAEEWRPLHEATRAAHDAAQRAHEAYHRAERALRSVA